MFKRSVPGEEEYFVYKGKYGKERITRLPSSSAMAR
jgi:hypothetical protein